MPNGSYLQIKCMIVDDEPMAIEVVKRYIGLMPTLHLVGEFHNAIEATIFLQEQSVDIIFLDIRMPIMDGFEFMQEFEKLDISKKNIKIYLLSSSLDPADVQRSSDNGYITQLIHKPLTKQILEGISV